MKVAIFDIDGVLVKGFAIIDFWNHLAENGIIDADKVLENKKTFDRFKKGKLSYREMAINGMKHTALAYKGVSEKKIKKISTEFLMNNKIDVFDYTVPLINLLKKNKIKLIAISGSNIEFIENYKDILGLYIIHGTEFEVINGKYTGSIKLNLALKESKEKIIIQYNRADKILGFGDTDQDVSILESVKFPIAINPSKKLASIAASKGWIILNENDDVVGKVEQLIS